MLTGMTEQDWRITLEVFDAVQSSQGEPGHDDRKFLEAIHYFAVHSITWRALPEEFGNWNSVWKRFWRLSRSGVFEAFFQVLAECSETAHLIQFFDSTTARAHVSAAGAKGGSRIRPSAARVVASRPKSTSRPSRRPSSRLPSDPRRGKRQHAVRDFTRHRPRRPPAHRDDR
jgi:transposase